MTECAMEANVNWGAGLPPKKTGLQTQPSTLRTVMLKATYEIWGRGACERFPNTVNSFQKEVTKYIIVWGRPPFHPGRKEDEFS